MNDEDLMRRISAALDADGGLDADDDLRAVLAEDPAAMLYAQDLQAIDEALGQLGTARGEPDWEAMLERIDRGLERDLEGLELEGLHLEGLHLEGLVDGRDPTEPPVFEDDIPRAEREVVAANPAEPTHEPVVAPVNRPVAAAASPAVVVDLASARRRRRQIITVIGGLAAAAAVGLGITTGLQVNDEAPTVGFSMDEAEQAAPAAADMGVTAEPPPSPDPMGYPLAEAEAAEEPMAEAPAEINEASPMRRAMASRGAPAPSAAAPSAPADLDDLFGSGEGSRSSGLARAGGGGGSLGAATTTTATAEPTRVEVVNALNAVADEVARCMTDTRELARVQVRVNGSTGTIESVRVSPPFAGAEAACIVRAVRGATMPRSGHPTYDVTHAYHPAPVAGGSLRPGAPAARRARERRAAPALRDQADILSPFE
ncbi:MAG: hypothetical protein H6719_00615 [Sandaracinaceae bacterium]|nr:hypothetical protein [Sandaracinaceae bacterium]